MNHIWSLQQKYCFKRQDNFEKGRIQFSFISIIKVTDCHKTKKAIQWRQSNNVIQGTWSKLTIILAWW